MAQAKANAYLWQQNQVAKMKRQNRQRRQQKKGYQTTMNIYVFDLYPKEMVTGGTTQRLPCCSTCVVTVKQSFIQ